MLISQKEKLRFQNREGEYFLLKQRDAKEKGGIFRLRIESSLDNLRCKYIYVKRNTLRFV